MIICDVSAVSLGYDEGAGVDKDGKNYDFRRFSYVIEGERDSRKFYIDKDAYTLLSSVRDLEWGYPIKLSGDIDGKGRISISKIEKAEE